MASFLGDSLPNGRDSGEKAAEAMKDAAARLAQVKADRASDSVDLTASFLLGSPSADVKPPSWPTLHSKSTISPSLVRNCLILTHFVTLCTCSISTAARFARFFADSFDVSQYIRELLQSTAQATSAKDTQEGANSSNAGASTAGKASGSSAEVSRAVTELGEVIRSQVSTYKKPLLRQALHVLHMDKWLTNMHQNVQTFNDHFLQVRHDLREPFQALSEQGQQISKAHKVSHLLRSVHLFMIQLTRLKRVLGNESAPSSLNGSSGALSAPSTPSATRASDLPTTMQEIPTTPQKPSADNAVAPTAINLSQAASLVYELLKLVETERLTGIEVVDRETPWIKSLQSSLKTKSAKWLHSLSQPAAAPSSPAPSDKDVPQIEIPTISEAVHVLYSLNALGEVLTQVLELRRKATLKQITTAMDATQHRTAATPAQGGSAIAAATSSSVQKSLFLWTQLEKLFRETLPSHIDFLLTLHRLLVSLWKRTIQQSSDDRSGSIDTGPSLDDPHPFSADSSSSLSSFLRFLRNNGPISEELEALSNANDPVAVVKHLWVDVVETEFCDAVLRAIKKYKALEPMLSTDFPRLLRLLHALSEHVTTQLERSGVNFGVLLRNYKLHGVKHVEKPRKGDRKEIHERLASSTSSASHDALGSLAASRSSVSLDSSTPEQRSTAPSSKYHFVQPSAISSSQSHDSSHDGGIGSTDGFNMPGGSAFSSLDIPTTGWDSSASKMELIVGDHLWHRMSTRLQPIELEYQKILVAQFFTPINGMFAAGTASTSAPAPGAQESGSAERWQIFGPLGSAKGQKGGVVVGGRMLLPGEVILALSSKSDNTGSSSYVVGGRWVGGSPYLCKWLALIKTHFDALQNASRALLSTLLPKFLMALNKSIKLFMLKTEEVLSHEEESAQISEMPPVSQRFNAAVFNALASAYSFLHQYILGAIESKWKAEADGCRASVNDFASSLQAIAVLASQHILQPIFKRASSALSKCLFVDLHQTNWNEPSNDASSLYIRTLTRFVAHFSTYILPLFTTASNMPSTTRTLPIVAFHIQTLTKSFASNYALSSSLIRHISENGRLRLMKDVVQIETMCQTLEAATAPSTTPQQLGSQRTTSSLILHTFRELLYSDFEAIVNSVVSSTSGSSNALASSSDLSTDPRSKTSTEAEGRAVTPLSTIRSIPATALLHLVLHRAPTPEAVSPISSKNMSSRQYAEWLYNTPIGQIWNAFQLSIAEARRHLSPTSDKYAASEAALKATESIGSIIAASNW